MTDQIEIRRQGGKIDEVFAKGCDVHLERMGSDRWFLIFYRPDGSAEAFWLGREKHSVNITMHESRQP